ncbi:MAG: Calx-beta domain-containing protein [Cyanobacteriota bacterium]
MSNLTDVNGTLYFTANNGTNGTELYRINNATASPALIDIITGSGSSSPSYLTNVNGTLYFQAYDNATGYKLWRIDPTTGTPSVVTVASGSDYSSPYNLLNANGVLYFTAYNNTTGYELWKVDPTTGNAVFLKDIYEGGNSSSPGNLTYSNGKLYFTADNGINGVELWAVDVDSVTTIGNVEKTGDEDQVVTFASTDFSSVFTSGSGLPLAQIQIINLPSNGVLKLGDNPVTVNQEIAVADLGGLTFTPAANYNGGAGFTWNGSDGTDYAPNPSTVTLLISAVNDAPTLVNPLADTSIFSNRSSNFGISVNAFQDVDFGDVLTYSATLADGSPLPTWLTFNERTFSGNPTSAQAGQYDVVVTVTDQDGASASDTFVLSVVNSAPTNIALSQNTVTENSANNTVIGQLSASDNNTNDTHTFSLVDDAGGRFAIVGNQLVVANGSLLDYETNTQHTIRVQTTDNTGLSYQRNLTVLIANVADELAGVLSFTSSVFSVNENGAVVNAVTIQRANGSEGTVSVNVLLSDGTAVYPNDYNSLAVPVVFGPGEMSKTVTLPIVNDSDFEGNETLTVTLSTPTGGATLGSQVTALVTIIDNDLPTISLTVTPPSVTENGSGNLSYVFTRTGNNANPLTVNFTVGGAATFGDDYTVTGAASFAAGAGAVTFAAGASTATLVVDPVADAVFETDETVSLTLTSSADYSLGTPGVITGTILNDDLAAGVLSFGATEFSVSEDGTPVGAVTLVRSGNLTGSVSVTLNLTNGTATAPSDYTNTPITVNFADGENSKIVTIPIVNDSQFEADETVNLTLSNPQGGAVLGDQTTAVLTILNDDLPQPGTILLNSGAYTVNENGTANITLIRSGGSDGEVSVTLTPADGTATAGSDYNDSPITVTFANGQTSRTVTIPLLDDAQFEPVETVNLTLSNPTGGAVLGTQSTAVLTIIDNDAVPGVIQFSNGAYSVNEDGTPVTAVTLTRTGGSDGAVSVRVNLTNGTATAGSDYNNAPITVNFADGETSKIVTIPIVNDSQFEADETINLSLANATGGATLGAQNTALVTIIDDDFQPTLSLTLSNATVAEGNSLQGTVSRNTPTTEPLTVTLFNSDNSQMTVPGTVTIPAGASSATFNLTAVDDTLIEPNRAYNLTASAQGFVSAATSVTVTDNDAVTLSLTLDSLEISENGGKATATVTRNQVTNTPLVVQLSSSNTTEAIVPATVTIAANQASATFEIEAVDDPVLDGSQTVAITATPIYTGGTLPLPTGAATTNLTVLDNESATLTLTFAQGIISETGTTIATLTRNANIGSALVVTLASSDTSEATVPQTVTIDAGQTSTTFTVTGVEDGSNDGSQPVTITASANGFNSDAKTLDVTDINVPDLVMTQLQGSANTYTNQQSQFTYTVSNNGLVTASGQWADRVYLSSDNKLDANDTLLGEFPLGSEENLANLLVGAAYDRAVTYFTPRNPGQYYLIGVTDTGNTVNEGLGIGETNNVTVTPLTVAPAYRASVYTDTDTALMGTAVTLRGQALSNINNAPVPFEFVKVRVENQGNIREFDAFTDANGNFVRQFNPLPGEAGAYNINAYFPGFAQEDSAPEDSFTLVGMRFEQNDQFLTQVSHRITEGTTFNGSVKLQNLSEVALSGLTASVIGAPSDWTVSVTPQKTGLGGNEEITVDYSINVPDDNWRFYNFGLGLNTTQGATATLPIRVDVTQLLPRLVADTSRLEASMLRGGQSVVEFTVTNQGDIPSGPLSLLLPEASWLQSASPATLPSLNPGESTQVSLLLQPSATQDLTVYNGNVVLVGEEASLSLPFNFRAVSEAQGNLNISVVNELFFFAEGSPRLANATITLLDPFTGTVIFSETDADGLLNKTNLAEGYYKLRITADSHDFYEQNIFIGAGETEEVQAFLSRQTVKYSWTVVPTEIQDQYTISIESIFETNVPIPTVVIEPGFIDLDSLQVIGQVMQVDIKVTNHGLIAANDINLNLGSHPFYQIEPLINGVDILAAKSSITIPVRITRIADFSSLASASGELALQSAPSVPCSISATIDYSYECAGEEITRDIPLPIFNVEGNCSSGGSSGSSWWSGSGGGSGWGGSGSGSGSGTSPRAVPIEVNLQDSNCDPCKEKNLQVLSCLIRSAGEKAKGLPGAVLTGINCWVNTANAIKDFEEGNYGDLPLPQDLCEPPDPLDCLENLCLDGFGGGGDGNDNNGPNGLNLTTSALAPANIASGLHTLERYRSYWNVIRDVALVYYGDEAWLAVSETDQPELQAWHQVFQSFAQGETIDDFKISETERQQLLATAFPEPLTEELVNKFIARWNRNIDYYRQGIFSKNDLTDGQNPDFMAVDELQSLETQIDDFMAVLASEGQADLAEATFDLSNELYDALSGEGGVCATVKIRIDQDLVMTRAAFLGTLEIENGNAADLEDLSVTLQIRDINGNIVNDLFGITDPVLSNISAVDGTGILTGDDPNTPQDEGIGSAQWTFIPTNFAAPEEPTQYSIGGTLSYVENGQLVTVPLLTAPITVFPQAELYLDYFHQRDVFADDPFTDDIVETSVPYSLAVLVRNEGKGDAKNLKITSGQPTIIENEKGLLIDFQIIGSEVNGQGVSPSLTVDFGNIGAGENAVAEWLLKSSLQGKFIDYQATFEHVNSLGKAELSLIKEVTIHELIHTVQADGDALSDFLVNGTFDAQFTPDILYFSSGGTAPVNAVQDATIDAPATLADLTVQISAVTENGWTYFRLDEPSDSQFDITSIQRSDGTLINASNLWTTDRTFPGTGRPVYENILHFLDYTNTGNTTYTVTYVPGGPTITDIIDVTPKPRANSVNAITVDFSEPVLASSFDYNDVSLTLNGGGNLINPTVTVVALSPTRYQITGLSDLTNNDGDYALTVNAGGIQDTSGKLGLGSQSETWTKVAGGNVDTTSPEVVDIVNLLINPRNQPVPSLTVILSEKIDLGAFTWQDITLTRNGGANLINNTVTISAIDDISYRINGLSALTAAGGTYTLTVNGGGIQDLSGNAGTGAQSESWVMDTLAPDGVSNLVVASAAPSGLQASSLSEFVTLTASGQQRVNTTTPYISGDLGETGLKVFFYDKGTNTLLQQATVTGTQFGASVALPSPGARELEIQVQDQAGNTTTTALSLFADITQPVLTQFLDVPASTLDPISRVDLQFSEPIDLNTFDRSDITLSRDGVALTLPNTVTVEFLSGTTYRINGLGGLTNTPGAYSLRVDATTIQDNAGNSGDAPKTATFTILAPPSPGVSLTQTGGNTTVTEGGNTDTYSLVLRTQPTANVVISLATGDQITLNQSTFTFTPSNWNVPQTVTVSAVDDALTEGAHSATITHTVASADSDYNGLTIPTINVGVQDNDAEIKGTVWNDLDGNAVNNSESGLTGWTVYIDANNNGQLDSGELSTQTDGNGNYQFNDLRPGTYSLAQVVQDGWQQTYPIFTVSTTGSSVSLAIPTLDFIVPFTDGPTELNFSAANYLVTEDGTALTEIVVTRSGNLAGTVSATLTFADGTAKGCGCAASSVNNDFNHAPITVTFAANEVSKVITVQNALLNTPNTIRIRNDEKIEGDEYFTLQLTNATNGAVIGHQSLATVTIVDDESPSNLLNSSPTTNTNTSLSSSLNSNALSLINLDDFWADSRFANITGQGYSTVIIDTGIDLNHSLFGPDLDNNGIADKILYQYDFADNDTDASDKNNHGSHVASIAAQIAPGSNLIVLKVFGDDGSGYFADLEAALQWVNTNATTYNIASVNLSLGDSQNWTTEVGRYGIGDELAAIANQNILVAAAAGNSFYTFNSAPGLSYPAVDPNVISVGAVWADDFGSRTFGNGAVDYATFADGIASFSQRHPLLDVFAPGILITGANATGGTISMGGTSQATPYISAIATLSQQIAQTYLERELTLSEFKFLLDTTSDLIIDGDNEADNVVNTGSSYPRVNVLALGEAILTLGDASQDSQSGNTGNDGADESPYVPVNTVSLVHTVTLGAGQVLENLNFGNQQTITPQPGTIQFNNSAYSVNEDGTVINTITLTRTGGSDGAVSLTLTPASGAATSPADFDNAAITVNFADGETSQTVAIPIVDDAVFEGDETVNLTLSNPTNGAVLGTHTTAVLTIVDNESAPTLTIQSVAGAEGNSGETRLFTFIVSLSGTVQGQVSVDYATANETATVENNDYVATTGTLAFFPGNTTNIIQITVNGDNIPELDETFMVNLSNPTGGAVLGQSQGVGTIINDESGIIFSGTDGNDNFTGGNGDDIIRGGLGNDTLNGKEGNDILEGGAGADILTGGAGADRFEYSNFTDSLVSGMDRISDFNPAQGDLIYLPSLPNGAFNAGLISATRLTDVIDSVFADADRSQTGPQPLGANEAIFFRWGAGRLKSAYLIVNDNASAFDSESDLVVNVTGLVGALTVGSLTPANYFASLT